MNILMLTNIYPHPDETTKNRTKVIAYFTREWVKMGHRVIVIVNSNKFPELLRGIGQIFSKQIFSTKYLEIPDKFWGKEFSYQDEGVEVINIPITKLAPGKNYSEKELKKQAKRIIDALKKSEFIPDVITGHWINPQLRMIAELGKVYDKAKTAFVFHGDYQKNIYDSTGAAKYLEEIDHIGFRSQSALYAAKEYMVLHNPFVCSSGVPKQYAENSEGVNNGCIGTNRLSFISAGRLVKSKNIDSVIDAFYSVINEIDIRDKLIIAGEGPLMEPLKERISDYHIDERVVLLGRIPRDELQMKMRDTRVFALISDNETFGLVYLEAMLQGCIVVASKYGGVDGIIIDGENGFLCEQGNKDELASIFRRIIKMPIEKRDSISRKAKETACFYTDENVAAKYLSTISQ